MSPTDPSPIYSPDLPVWQVMTISRTGNVSLLKNLTEDQARNAVRRLKNSDDPWTDDRIREQVRIDIEIEKNGGYTCSYCDFEEPLIRTIEYWGPDGINPDIWPKPADADERYDRIMAEEVARG